MKEQSKFIIVGNGASLLGRSLGSLIDTYEEVVRFNEFKTEGFEKDVGTKTTVWFYNHDVGHPGISSRLEMHRPARIYVHEWNIPDTAPLRLQAAIEHSGIKAEATRVMKKNFAEMTSFLGEKYSLWSSGAVAVWLLLQETEKVTLAGFDWWHKPAKFHYMNKQEFDHNSDNGHQPRIEKRFFDRLANAGRLEFLYD